ncbi:MAG: patatin-like phospholipase family protein [Sneathiellaceae bacterium]
MNAPDSRKPNRSGDLPAEFVSQTANALRGPCQRVALVLQGGGALGSYQAGAYEALQTEGYLPDWVAGISIGAINTAIIVGNRPEDRVPRLRAFWERMTAVHPFLDAINSDATAHLINAWSAQFTALKGVAGFFTPRFPAPFFQPVGTAAATSYYDTSQLRETLLEFVDFDLLNDGPVRLSVGAVNVQTGNQVFFDNSQMRIEVEHIMASGALPPGFPAVKIGQEFWWDGGLVSNNPLQFVLDEEPRISTLCFQIDLFSARGLVPRTLPEVEARQKDIQYSSRTRANTDRVRRMQDLRRKLHVALQMLPEEKLQSPEMQALWEESCAAQMHIAQLIYRPRPGEQASKDYEFSRATMLSRWRRGRYDTGYGLRSKGWLKPLPQDEGVATYDLTARV